MDLLTVYFISGVLLCDMCVCVYVVLLGLPLLLLMTDFYPNLSHFKMSFYAKRHRQQRPSNTRINTAKTTIPKYEIISCLCVQMCSSGMVWTTTKIAFFGLSIRNAKKIDYDINGGVLESKSRLANHFITWSHFIFYNQPPPFSLIRSVLIQAMVCSRTQPHSKKQKYIATKKSMAFVKLLPIAFKLELFEFIRREYIIYTHNPCHVISIELAYWNVSLVVCASLFRCQKIASTT